MNLSVAEALDAYIDSIEEPREPDGKYHPSSFWLCARAAVLGVRGIPQSNPPDAQTKRVFRIGHLMHEVVQSALVSDGNERGLSVYNEFGIDVPEWNMTGHGDSLREFAPGAYEVVEAKSTKSLRYTPKEDHLKQATIYFEAARYFGWSYAVTVGTAMAIGPYQGPPMGDALKQIRLVYLNKADMEVKEYIYPYDPKWRPAIEKRVAELDKFRLAEVNAVNFPMLPDPLPLDKGKPNWYTGYCNYKGSGMCCGDKEEAYEW